MSGVDRRLRVTPSTRRGLQVLYRLLYGGHRDGFACVATRRAGARRWRATAMPVDQHARWRAELIDAVQAGREVRVHPLVFTDAVAGDNAYRAEGVHQPLAWEQTTLVFRWPHRPDDHAVRRLQEAGGYAYGVPGGPHVGLLRLEQPKNMPAYTAWGTELAQLLGADPFRPSLRIPVPGFGPVRLLPVQSGREQERSA